jgi:hypothetical protein
MFSDSSPFGRREGEHSLHPRRRVALTPIFAHRPVQLAEGIPDREGLLELRRIVDAPSGKSHCDEVQERPGGRAQPLESIRMFQTSCRTGSR